MLNNTSSSYTSSSFVDNSSHYVQPLDLTVNNNNVIFLSSSNNILTGSMITSGYSYTTTTTNIINTISDEEFEINELNIKNKNYSIVNENKEYETIDGDRVIVEKYDSSTYLVIYKNGKHNKYKKIVNKFGYSILDTFISFNIGKLFLIKEYSSLKEKINLL